MQKQNPSKAIVENSTCEHLQQMQRNEKERENRRTRLFFLRVRRHYVKQPTLSTKTTNSLKQDFQFF